MSAPGSCLLPADTAPPGSAAPPAWPPSFPLRPGAARAPLCGLLYPPYPPSPTPVAPDCSPDSKAAQPGAGTPPGRQDVSGTGPEQQEPGGSGRPCPSLGQHCSLRCQFIAPSVQLALACRWLRSIFCRPARLLSRGCPWSRVEFCVWKPHSRPPAHGTLGSVGARP